jgi:hypothetical protein
MFVNDHIILTWCKKQHKKVRSMSYLIANRTFRQKCQLANPLQTVLVFKTLLLIHFFIYLKYISCYVLGSNPGKWSGVNCALNTSFQCCIETLCTGVLTQKLPMKLSSGDRVGLQKPEFLSCYKFPAMSSCRFFIQRPQRRFLAMRTNVVLRVQVSSKIGPFRGPCCSTMREPTTRLPPSMRVPVNRSSNR